MEERYVRNLGALTENECSELKSKKILVAGCGGLGGYIIDMLLRLGVGEIVAADGDVFEASNLNRQLLSTPELLGRSKAEAAGYYAKRINPEVAFHPVNAFIDKENVSELLCGCDAVMDALDSIAARKLLAKACADRGIPFIHGAVCGWTAHAGVSMPGDGLIDMLYPDEARCEDRSTLVFTPALCAAVQTALCVKLLCGREVETGKLYHADLLSMDLEKLF